MKKLLGSLLIVGLLFGCSSKEANIEETKENKVEEKVQQATPVKVETPRVEPKVESNKEALQDYFAEVMPFIDLMVGHLTVMSEISTTSSENPSLFFNEEFISLVYEASDSMYKTIYDIQTINTSDNSKVNEIHSVILMAMDEFEFVSTNFPVAMENLDTDLILECVAKMQQGSAYIQRATSMVEAINNEL